jgi:hypothetical protein
VTLLWDMLAALLRVAATRQHIGRRVTIYTVTDMGFRGYLVRTTADHYELSYPELAPKGRSDFHKIANQVLVPREAVLFLIVDEVQGRAVAARRGG